MLQDQQSNTSSHPRLEEFLKQYMEAVGGVWDEIEPEVYDVLLPSEVAAQITDLPSSEHAEAGETMLRLTLDPEAVQEHAQARLLTFGSHFLDLLFQHAHERCQTAQVHLTGFHLAPHDLPRRISRAITLAPDISLEAHQFRPLYFSNVIFWFQATFISDEKEQEIFPAAVDLHYGRQVRHMESLIYPQPPVTHVEVAPFAFPDAPRLPLSEGYRLAWKYVIGTVAAVANQRRREIHGRLQVQSARMTQYFEDMREELHERIARAEERETGAEALHARLDAINREEQVRLAELRQKSALRVELRLMNLLWVRQPKLKIKVVLTPKEGNSAEAHMVWDPLTEKLEALDCPICQHPTFVLAIHRSGTVVCQECSRRPGTPKR